MNVETIGKLKKKKKKFKSEKMYKSTDEFLLHECRNNRKMIKCKKKFKFEIIY